MHVHLVKKGEERKDTSALVPVQCFSVDASNAHEGKPAKSAFPHGTLTNDAAYDFSHETSA